ncbi:MAG: DNA recombination protein RmuC [Acutalibacteraceae bacterium]|nr:DNA recombination protein RmuC [Acutalibacteraceae bacterium]
MNTQTVTIMLGAVAVLLIISIVLLIILLKKNNNKDYETLLALQKENSQKVDTFSKELNSSLREEFSRSRMESMGAQKAQRQEIASAIENMSVRLSQMTKDNYEFNIKMSELISGKLFDMQKNNEQKLEQIRLTVDEKLNETLTKRLDSSFKAVSEQLENVYKSLGEMKVLSSGVTENVTSLNRILTNVKARGTWAEVQLEGLLNETIPGMFDKNVMTNPASRNIVEFAVKIPSGEDKSEITYLPIDSKFPVEAYIRLCSAADSGDSAMVEYERKSLERTILDQAKEIRKYINEPQTTPFAIMYLATEGLYSEIISSKNGIAEKCQNDYSVMVAGPSTITALLNSLSIGFRAMAINEKAKEVRQLLAAAKVQYDKFGIVLDKAKKKIDEAGRSLEEAQSRNTIIQKKLKGVEAIEQDAASQILGIEGDDF